MNTKYNNPLKRKGNHMWILCSEITTMVAVYDRSECIRDRMRETVRYIIDSNCICVLWICLSKTFVMLYELWRFTMSILIQIVLQNKFIQRIPSISILKWPITAPAKLFWSFVCRLKYCSLFRFHLQRSASYALTIYHGCCDLWANMLILYQCTWSGY